jgi:hypothetical protein
MATERKPLERKNSAIFKMNNAIAQSPATGQSPTMPAPSLDLRKSYGTNWTKSNVSVLFEWVTIAAYNIRCLELAISHYRRKIRANTILGIVLSTLSGTIATAQAGFPNSVTVNLTIILNVIFIVMTFTIAITTGYIKIYQIQEHLELNIKAKQDWISFSADIASELQLPIELRKDALWMIIKNKNIYLDLLKTNLEIPVGITRQAQKDLKTETKLNMDVSSLPRILMDIAIQEMRDISVDNKEDRISSVVQKQLTHLVTQPADSLAWKTKKQLEAISEENELVPERSIGSVKDVHQVVTLDMSGSPTHPHLELRPT